MSINSIILYANIAAWILPPFRQYKSIYFKFFFVLALIDPLSLGIYYAFIINPFKITTLFSYLLLIALFDIRTLWKAVYAAAGLAVLAAITLSSSNHIANLLVLLLHLLILLVFIIHFVRWIGNNQFINLFSIALILYETTIIMKLLVVLTGSANFVIYFNVTTGFEILLAVFFMFFRCDDKRIHIKLSKIIPE